MNVWTIILIFILTIIAMALVFRILDFFSDFQAETCYQRRRNYRLRLKIKQNKKLRRQK